MTRNEQIDEAVYSMLVDAWARRWDDVDGRWSERQRGIPHAVTFEDRRTAGLHYAWARYRHAKFRFAVGLVETCPEPPSERPPERPAWEQSFRHHCLLAQTARIDREIGFAWRPPQEIPRGD